VKSCVLSFLEFKKKVLCLNCLYFLFKVLCLRNNDVYHSSVVLCLRNNYVYHSSVVSKSFIILLEKSCLLQH
jgi:hypothetical protein